MALFTATARAQSTTDGNYLLGSCQISLRVIDNPDITTTLSKYEIWRDGLCQGIVQGIGDVSPLACPTEGVKVMQEIRVVVKYLQDHPEKLNLRGSELISSALSQAFPCSK